MHLVASPYIFDAAATPASSLVPSLAAFSRYAQGLKKPSRPADLNCAAHSFSRRTMCAAPTRSAQKTRPPRVAGKPIAMTVATSRSAGLSTMPEMG